MPVRRAEQEGPSCRCAGVRRGEQDGLVRRRQGRAGWPSPPPRKPLEAHPSVPDSPSIAYSGTSWCPQADPTERTDNKISKFRLQAK
ncbi:hypothetical protein BDA96_07G118900 [Sorghum bicolor]|uniref:Uncharacterized protein n=2 Tax=Sorghum bicolor TaxID=4558 RepID=A0A921QK54_SORBI|nr:hypothetical protein BDA96_07G118900 [Sorghum bicolor]OQU80329.1 hypothetical protein SORBI_3007G111901 [Sorghum bicolor]